MRGACVNWSCQFGRANRLCQLRGSQIGGELFDGWITLALCGPRTRSRSNFQRARWLVAGRHKHFSLFLRRGGSCRFHIFASLARRSRGVALSMRVHDPRGHRSGQLQSETRRRTAAVETLVRPINNPARSSGSNVTKPRRGTMPVANDSVTVIEPVEGQFSFAWVDALIRQAPSMHSASSTRSASVPGEPPAAGARQIPDSTRAPVPIPLSGAFVTSVIPRI